MKINDISFTIEDINSLSKNKIWKNWPVVYILHNNAEAYIGETTSAYHRIKQHREKEVRKKLTEIKIITDKRFNKSAVLDIESKLIEYMSADKKFILQNINSGMRNHDYYDKKSYLSLFEEIWKQLKKKSVVQHDLQILENSDLFKYTPYKNLTEEQFDVSFRIACDLLEAIHDRRPLTFLINGEAGTGKTVLAMYILKLLADKKLIDFVTEQDELLVDKYKSITGQVEKLKFALVVPMTSLRSTLKEVVNKVSGLNRSMVIGPSDVVKNEYDILIVDEAHRLRRRVNIVNYKGHDQNNELLGLDKEGTELDWIRLSSVHQIFFYDETQTIRPTDVRADDFDEIISNENTIKYNISSQLRSLGGEDFIKYVKQLLSNNPPPEKLEFENFRFILFDSISKLKAEIIKKNEEFGLSRLVAGYGWKWKTKRISYSKIKEVEAYDIKIEDEKFIWNKKSEKWINSPNAINEVGSIHTTQGYDLNYIGVIMGPEITYDKSINQIKIDEKNYFDINGKKSILNIQELHDYIINIYSILLTRGIHGTYLYVCDPNLREFLSQYIEKI